MPEEQKWYYPGVVSKKDDRIGLYNLRGQGGSTLGEFFRQRPDLLPVFTTQYPDDDSAQQAAGRINTAIRELCDQRRLGRPQ